MKGGMIMKKNVFCINLIFFLFIMFLFIFSNYCFGAGSYPKLVSKLSNGFEQIKTWILKISTPAAAVAVRDWRLYEKI